MAQVARALVADGKGLLAMDESRGTCNKRFAAAGIPHTEEARRADQELIVTAPGLGESIGGSIRASCNRAELRGEYSAAMEQT